MPPMVDETIFEKVIVIDLGSRVTKVGLAGDDQPLYVLPTAVALKLDIVNSGQETTDADHVVEPGREGERKEEPDKDTATQGQENGSDESPESTTTSAPTYEALALHLCNSSTGRGGSFLDVNPFEYDVSSLVFPIDPKTGLVSDWEKLEIILRKILSNSCCPEFQPLEDCAVLLLQPPVEGQAEDETSCAEENGLPSTRPPLEDEKENDGRQTDASAHENTGVHQHKITRLVSSKLASLLFEKFSVPACHVVPTAPALSALPAGRGSTALVVSSGFSKTYVVPVIDGAPVLSAVCSSEMGGKDLSLYLARLLEKNRLGMLADKIENVDGSTGPGGAGSMSAFNVNVHVVDAVGAGDSPMINPWHIDVIDDIKENYCFVSPHYDTSVWLTGSTEEDLYEMRRGASAGLYKNQNGDEILSGEVGRADTDNHNAEMSERQVQNSSQMPMSSDGSFLSILERTRFQVPEVLFKPELIGGDRKDSLPELILRSLDSVDVQKVATKEGLEEEEGQGENQDQDVRPLQLLELIEMKQKLLRNIVLSGGNLKFPNLESRLKDEVVSLLYKSGRVYTLFPDDDEQQEVYNSMKSPTDPVDVDESSRSFAFSARHDVQIVEHHQSRAVRNNLDWAGGSILASLDEAIIKEEEGFHKLQPPCWVTKEEWEEVASEGAFADYEYFEALRRKQQVEEVSIIPSEVDVEEDAVEEPESE
ncbi:unnamed protein product [Amoebophrya sp. A120]|nr:unnamed protein product [Amoebophrya sp. A120]|eukprot:GSA120T00019682001.1